MSDNNEPLQVCFIVPEDLPRDLEMMVVWTQTIEHYKNHLTKEQFKASVSWFKFHVDELMDKTF